MTAALLLITGLSFLGALFRLVPVLYNWVRQRPVFHLLFDVLALEAELRAPGADDRAESIAYRLDGLDKRANRLLHRGVPVGLAALPLICGCISTICTNGCSGSLSASARVAHNDIEWKAK